MLIFHWFLQYNMHVRNLHALPKLKLARARRGTEIIKEMSIRRRQKIAKIYENLSKLNTEMKCSQKTSSDADLGLILGPPSGFKITKNGKKSKPKK